MRIDISKVFGFIFRKIQILFQRKFKGISIFCFSRLTSFYKFKKHLLRIICSLLIWIDNFFSSLYFIYYFYFKFLFFTLLVTCCVQIWKFFFLFAYLVAKYLKREIYIIVFTLISRNNFNLQLFFVYFLISIYFI